MPGFCFSLHHLQFSTECSLPLRQHAKTRTFVGASLWENGSSCVRECVLPSVFEYTHVCFIYYAKYIRIPCVTKLTCTYCEARQQVLLRRVQHEMNSCAGLSYVTSLRSSLRPSLRCHSQCLRLYYCFLSPLVNEKPTLGRVHTSMHEPLRAAVVAVAVDLVLVFSFAASVITLAFFLPPSERQTDTRACEQGTSY